MQVTQGTTKETERPQAQLDNPIGLDGMEFVEYSSKDSAALEKLFTQLGFKEVGQHKTKNVSLWNQGRIHFIINREQDSFAEHFNSEHGPSVCATGFRVKDATFAFEEALRRGAKPCPASKHHSFPAIYGIGNSVIYFIDDYNQENIFQSFGTDFEIKDPVMNTGYNMQVIDHLTNNVPVGGLKEWSDFYENIFNFKEIRFFDIKGQKTGLISRAMRSPCGKITIPINEPTGQGSQIQEYLDEYKGSGIQHIALLTTDICSAIGHLQEEGIEFLTIPETYYEWLPKRVANISEDIDALQKLHILVDGDERGYLLQIFTQTVIGPIFFEIIERKGHDGFGEGNFQALFDSIEEDQRRRGYLKD